MVGKDTHLAGLGRDVDLNNVLGLVDGLCAAISSDGSIVACRFDGVAQDSSSLRAVSGSVAYLVGEGQAELDLSID